MSRAHHAFAGATTLTTVSWSRGPSLDARASFGLVGTLGSSITQPEPSFDDPVEAAARWLRRTAQRGDAPQELVTLATRSLDTARDHAHALELMAGAVAQDASRTGEVDHARLEQVERMSETLAAWSTRLRALIDERGDAEASVIEQLRVAIEAGAAAGSLEALVARL